MNHAFRILEALRSASVNLSDLQLHLNIPPALFLCAPLTLQRLLESITTTVASSRASASPLAGCTPPAPFRSAASSSSTLLEHSPPRRPPCRTSPPSPSLPQPSPLSRPPSSSRSASVWAP